MSAKHKLTFIHIMHMCNSINNRSAYVIITLHKFDCMCMNYMYAICNNYVICNNELYYGWSHCNFRHLLSSTTACVYKL